MPKHRIAIHAKEVAEAICERVFDDVLANIDDTNGEAQALVLAVLGDVTRIMAISFCAAHKSEVPYDLFVSGVQSLIGGLLTPKIRAEALDEARFVCAMADAEEAKQAGGVN